MNRINLCIAWPNHNPYCETFIRAHRERLPCRITPLIGGHAWVEAPWKDTEGLPLLPASSDTSAEDVNTRPTLESPGKRDDLHSLVRFFRDQKIDAVLAEYGTTGVKLFSATEAARIPLIVHFHGFDAYKELVFVKYGSAYSEMLSRVAAVVVVSRHMHSRLKGLGVPPTRLHHVACGVNEIFQDPAAPANVPPHFVAVGAFVDKKAPHLTVLAFHRVWLKVPQARLKMIGTGPLFEACSQLRTALGMDDVLVLKGPCLPDEVAASMRHSRAFVQHSVCTSDHNMEGTPVAVMEAGVCGLPVVATRHAGIPDVITDKVTGFLVEEHDIDTMATHMVELAQDPSLAGRMGAESRRLLKDSCSMERSIENLWEVICQALEQR